jgi:hypothetical protein
MTASVRAKRGFFDFVTAVLAFESLLGIVTFGLLMTPKAILRSPVSIMQLIIIAISFSDGGYDGRHVLGIWANCLLFLCL